MSHRTKQGSRPMIAGKERKCISGGRNENPARDTTVRFRLCSKNARTFSLLLSLPPSPPSLILTNTLWKANLVGSSLSCSQEEIVADAEAGADAAADADAAGASPPCGVPGAGATGGLAPPWTSRVKRRTLRRMNEYLRLLKDENVCGEWIYSP